MKYKAILYDMDGTVLDTLADLTAAVNHSLSVFGLATVPASQVRRSLGNGAKRLIAGCIQRMNKKSSRISSIRAD